MGVGFSFDLMIRYDRRGEEKRGERWKIGVLEWKKREMGKIVWKLSMSINVVVVVVVWV